MMVGMLLIVSSEQDQFLRMVAKQLSERKPSFVPQDERKERYFATIGSVVTVRFGVGYFRKSRSSSRANSAFS
jgi:hypothetical protein